MPDSRLTLADDTNGTPTVWRPRSRRPGTVSAAHPYGGCHKPAKPRFSLVRRTQRAARRLDLALE